MATVKEQIKTEVKAENAGDLALTHSVDSNTVIDPKRILNAHNFKKNVWPGYVVNKKDRKKNYQFYWWREDTNEFAEDELDSLKEIGFFFVTEAEFDVKKWNRTTDGRIRQGKFLLLALDEETHTERRDAKYRQLGASMDAQSAGVHNLADQAGFGSWETRGGKTREVVKGRSEVDLG